MFIVFNIIVIVLGGFIAYWWANQGAFSALLHLLCVIIAGAIALAFWEPLVGLTMRGSLFDNYAWGVMLVVPFALSLFILRLIMDRLVPFNIALPHWANLIFGGAAGAAAAVLSLGILIIGIGFIQSSSPLLGYYGWARDHRTAEVRRINSLWIPVDTLTANFYSWLSVTTLKSGRPLRQYAPELDRQATLVRDSYRNGRGQLSLRPSEASVRSLYEMSDGVHEHILVDVHFNNGARDFGQQLTLSSAQVRLIGAARGTNEPDVAYPVAWKREDKLFLFDGVTSYITSVPGREYADIILDFEVPSGFQPSFIQIRNTRYDLRRITAQQAPASLVAMFGRRGGGVTPQTITPQPIGSVIAVSNDIRPVNVSTNMLPPSIKEVDKYLTQGSATFGQSGTRPSPGLRVLGIYEPPGTRCVQLDVSRNGPADIFRLLSLVPERATLALVDSRGTQYSPIGYIYRHLEGTTIRLEPSTHLRSIEDLPILPTSGTERLKLIFYVTDGVTLTTFRFGDFVVGTCNLFVPEKQ